MFWPETSLLESVGLHEPVVDGMRESICHAITQAIVPLRAYCKQYEVYLDFMNLGVKDFIK